MSGFVVINEKTTYNLLVKFIDQFGQQMTPSSASYRIDDASTAVAKTIKPLTSITPTESSYTIIITPMENKILSPINKYELRTVTVFYATEDYSGNSEFEYLVKNLRMVP